MRPTARKEVVTKTVTQTTQVPVIVLEMTEKQATKLAMLLAHFGSELFADGDSPFGTLTNLLEEDYGNKYSLWKLAHYDVYISTLEAIVMRAKDAELTLECAAKRGKR